MEKIPKITAQDIEIAIAKHFSVRQKIIVPNVHWGFGLSHECDMLIISSSNYATEIEIKISKSDLLKDSLKPHQHKSNLIKQLYFAIPYNLKHLSDKIQDNAGILLVDTNRNNDVKLYRTAKINKQCRQLTNSEVFNVTRLGCMRIYTLKKKLQKIRIDKYFNSIKN